MIINAVLLLLLILLLLPTFNFSLDGLVFRRLLRGLGSRNIFKTEHFATAEVGYFHARSTNSVKSLNDELQKL